MVRITITIEDDEIGKEVDLNLREWLIEFYASDMPKVRIETETVDKEKGI